MKKASEIFREWYDQHVEYVKGNPSVYGDPSAMVLATSSASGSNSARMVLLKEFNNDAFVFFTNYNSIKALQLSSNYRAALLFWWPHLQRQIRIEGVVLRTTREESDAYFATRPRESQLGAWASDQSNKIKSMNTITRRMEKFRQKFGDEIPRPRHWGGYRLSAERYEFWQEGENRLHNRLVYEKTYAGWETMLLAP
jgi:pyridoxamine 5'-phosphate oxidase